MNVVNQNNYETYYLDYLEGNLDEDCVDELFLFLNDNPNIKEELDEFDFVKINADLNETFDKDILKKNINNSNVEDYIISSIEGEIQQDDSVELKKFIAKSDYAKQLELRYEKTILPNKRIVYPAKDELKKRIIPFQYLTPIISVAALLLLLFYVIPHFSEEEIYKPISKNEKNNSTQHVNLIKEIPIENTIKEAILEDKTNTGDLLVSNISAKHEDVHNVNSIAESKLSVEVVLINDSVANAVTVEKQAVVIDLDSIYVSRTTNVNQKQIVENVIIAAENQTNSNSEVLPLKQWAVQAIKKKLFRKEGRNVSSDIKGKEIISAVVDKIDEQSSVDIAYNFNENEIVNSYSISIGNFEFARSKRIK